MVFVKQLDVSLGGSHQILKSKLSVQIFCSQCLLHKCYCNKWTSNQMKLQTAALPVNTSAALIRPTSRAADRLCVKERCMFACSTNFVKRLLFRLMFSSGRWFSAFELTRLVKCHYTLHCALKGHSLFELESDRGPKPTASRGSAAKIKRTLNRMKC